MQFYLQIDRTDGLNSDTTQERVAVGTWTQTTLFA